MTWLERTLGSAALFGALAITGCSPYGALCADKMDCEGGNDADVDACVIQSEAAEDVAYNYDCGDDWDEYVACLEDRSRCSNNVFGPGDDCANEFKRANECVKDRR